MKQTGVQDRLYQLGKTLRNVQRPQKMLQQACQSRSHAFIFMFRSQVLLGISCLGLIHVRLYCVTFSFTSERAQHAHEKKKKSGDGCL